MSHMKLPNSFNPYKNLKIHIISQFRDTEAEAQSPKSQVIIYKIELETQKYDGEIEVCMLPS